MTQKPFGVKQLNVIGAAGTPTIESAGDLNIGGQQVAITTNTSIAGVITATSFFGDGSGLTGITGSGSGVVIQEEGSSVGTAGTINFIGTGVTATLSGGIASVEITSTGGGGGGIDGISTTGTSFFNQLNVSGVSTFQGDAYFGDNDYIRMGDANGGDLRFYHAGGAGSYIDHVNSNDLYIRAGSGSGSTKLRITDTSNNLKAIFDTDNTSGGVELYYGLNQKKFETTSNGIEVTGNISVNDTTVVGSATSSLSTLTQTAIHTELAVATYRSVEYTIQATEGTNFHATKILALHNGTTAYHNEYGTVFNNSSVASFDVDISGGNIRLLASGASASQTDYVVNFVATKV